MNIYAACHFTDCSLEELKNQSIAVATFMTDVSSLDDAAAQYPSCDAEILWSFVLVDTRLNIATVAYYSGTTPGSRVCFICDKSNGYVLNTTFSERYCQSDGTWSRSPTICGTLFIRFDSPNRVVALSYILNSLSVEKTLSNVMSIEFVVAMYINLADYSLVCSCDSKTLPNLFATIRILNFVCFHIFNYFASRLLY